MEEKRGFQGVWIPKEIWLNKELSWIEKLFITEIKSLDDNNGCFASNTYFGTFFNLSPHRCSEIISSLIKKKFIEARYERKGKQITKRILRVINTDICVVIGKPSGVVGKRQQGSRKMSTPPSENVKDINTVNNTVINTIDDDIGF
jgi:hypothetical protein